jgi:hypothetical protein
MILASHGLIASSIGQFDPDALAFFARVTAAGGTLSATEQSAILTLVADLKDDGIWTKMKAIYPMVGGGTGTTAQRQAACAQNLKSSSFTGTFSVTGWTYSSTGVLNLGSGEFDTGLNLNIMNSINDISYGYYNRTNTPSTGSFGWGRPTAITNEFFIRYTNGVKYGYLFDSGNDGGAVADCRGFNAMSRTASNNKFIQLNSSISTFTSASSGTLVSRNFIFGRGSQGFENRENALGFVGDAITSQNMSDFYDAVQAFQTTLSRQV